MDTNETFSVIFFDARDTLGEVDRPGHLIPYRPSTEKLLQGVKAIGLTIGVITNLPDDVTSDQGKDMIMNAVLSQDASTGKINTIGDFLVREHIITNHDAGLDKPDPRIFAYAAEKLGVSPTQCLFMGENLLENLGAEKAGMRKLMKPCPPGREFAPALVGKIGASPVDSGRQFEAFFEHEHLLGARIFACGDAIAAAIRELVADKTPPLDRGVWISPPAITLPDSLHRAIAFFVHLIDHFADQVHLRAEESMLEVAIACGMSRDKGQWVFDQHDQARAYRAAMNVAWRRIQNADDDDRFFALIDFQRTIESYVFLFKAHAVREDDQMYPEAGRHFEDSDDTLVMNLITHFGPPDITPFVGMVERMERLLGIVRA